MENLNSRHFTIPYTATGKSNNGQWIYQYWSLKVSITITSPQRFFAGDVMRLISVDEDKRVIHIEPAQEVSENLNSFDSLILISNDIPLSEQDEYVFWYYGCNLLVHFESKDQKNKIYTFALLIQDESACIKAFCRESKSRISFQIFNDKEIK